jgi:hypothetical protein
MMKNLCIKIPFFPSLDPAEIGDDDDDVEDNDDHLPRRAIKGCFTPFL